MTKTSKIYVAGHRGLVGSAIVRELQARGYQNILVRTHGELDLTSQAETLRFFEIEKPEYVFLSAAKVGGIYANDTYPADFIYQNMMIATNVIHSSYKVGVKKLLNLGSSCIYPKFAPQPLKEEYLLTGALEETNEAYAIAKISAIKLCTYYNKQYGTNFLSGMPTNLYGPNDNFDLNTSHVLPAILRKIHEAKVNRSPTVTLWGSGKPKREFLYSDDLAKVCAFLMENKNANEIGEFINIGTGEDISIAELAELIKSVVGWAGEFIYDSSKPDGTPRKLMSVDRLFSLGWKPETSLDRGIERVYRAFLEQYSQE